MPAFEEKNFFIVQLSNYCSTLLWKALAAQGFLSMVYLSIRKWDPDKTYGR